jgi:hypothetical protein
MSFSLTGLTSYVNQNTLPLMTKAVFGAKSIAMANKMVGLKSTSAINIMDTTAAFAYGVSCAFSNNGTTTFSQRNIDVKHLKVHESLCPQALEQTWLQHHLPQGSLYQAIPFEEAYANQKVAMIARNLESISWIGDSTSINGWKDVIDAVTGGTEGVTDPINANATAYTGNASAITKAQFNTNATGTTSRRTVLQAIERAIPTDILGSDDVVVFCGWDVFRLFRQDIVASNYFNLSYYEGMQSGEMVIPGSNIKLVAVPGLNEGIGGNTSYSIYAMRTSNLVFGTDLLNEQEKFEIFYAKEAMEVRFICEFKAGFQVAFPEQIVKFVMA